MYILIYVWILIYVLYIKYFHGEILNIKNAESIKIIIEHALFSLIPSLFRCVV